MARTVPTAATGAYVVALVVTADDDVDSSELELRAIRAAAGSSAED
jgi:hypothetical protein